MDPLIAAWIAMGGTGHKFLYTMSKTKKTTGKKPLRDSNFYHEFKAWIADNFEGNNEDLLIVEHGDFYKKITQAFPQYNGDEMIRALTNGFAKDNNKFVFKRSDFIREKLIHEI
jgi:hypothetical protein